MSVLTGFLLTRQRRDRNDGLEFEFWVAAKEGPVRILITRQEAVFFLPRHANYSGPGRREALELVSLSGVPVDGIYSASSRKWRDASAWCAAKGIAALESEVKPEDRYLMERFICGGMEIEGDYTQRDGYREYTNPVLRSADVAPNLSVLSFDIETEGLTGALYSIAGVIGDKERVFISGGGTPSDTTVICQNEREVLVGFMEWVQEIDPDILIGWNVVGFDLSFLDQKCKEWKVPFRLGRANATASVIPPLSARQQAMSRVPGRIVLDGIPLLRLGFWNFERYSLEFVAQALLGRGKDVKDPESRLYEIRRMYKEDPDALARYNLEDCRLVLEIFEKADLIRFAVERTKLTGLPMDRYGGSVAAFDYLYLPLLHREGVVAPDTGSITNPVESPGGYVMDSKPGLYDNVLVLDFKSLYPSIIRTFKIDPLGLAQPGEDPVPGFVGATFNREKSILPDLITSLWGSREQAKRENNQALQLAIKIIMNSFYGVLGSTGCRFFNPKLASSITKRGHELLTRSKSHIEDQGYGVIYGDTDSLFVLIGPGKDEDECKDIGTTLANALNKWWKKILEDEYRLPSNLEIEFETHYIRFFMPTIRGSEVGSKKRYAGYVRNKAGDLEMKFKGLESVRTDWTPLAREFQQELYRRIFFEEPYEEYMRNLVEEMLSGSRDDSLVYRKRIRRKLEDYTKNVPPHVQAARKLEKAGKWVEYVITINGPEPIQKTESPLDYAHYLDRQLAPVADNILHLFNTSFESITGRQMELF